MAIVRMISRDPAEFRAFQSRMTTVGKIRLGQMETPEGRKARPVKLDRFRFTSPTEALIRAVAERYGGEVEQWTPQGSRVTQWEAVSDVAAVPVYMVNGQDLDPWYEAWAAGRTCVRRCDGEINKIDQSPCLCNGPDRPSDPRQLCKPTIRVQVMLSEIPGIGSWMLESHGENACAEIATFGPLVARAPMPIPAMLRLRREQRREWNPDKRGGAGFESKDFYVPWFEVFGVTARQVAIGGDALTTALAAAGAPALLGGDRRAIEAAPPMSAPPAQTPQAGAGITPTPIDPAPRPADNGNLRPGEPDPNGGIRIDREEFTRILAAIEGAPNLPHLDGIRNELARRNIRYKAVMDAWVSKRAAIEAAEQLNRMAEVDPDGFADAVDSLKPEDRAELRRRLTALENNDGSAFTSEPSEYKEHFSEPPVGRGEGPQHLDPEDVEQLYEGEPVGELVGAAVLGHQQDAVEGEVEGDGLPMLPDGDYQVAEQWPALMTLAGQRTPPWTLDQTRAAVVAAFDLNHVGEASGLQLARVAAAMKQGLL